MVTGNPFFPEGRRKRSRGYLLIRVLILLWLGAQLPGCAGVGRESGEATLTGVQEALYSIETWKLEGRIGVRTETDAWQANLDWDHDTAVDRLRVSGPLGQGMVSILVQKDLISVDLGEGRVERSRDPDGLLRERLGFSVPLGSMRYWIMGVPAPGSPYTSVYKHDGVWAGFRQSGWTIAVERTRQVDSRVLPQKLRVQGNGVKLTISADEWELKG